MVEWYVEEELRSGEVPFRWFGNQRVIERTDLDKWVDKQRKQTGKLAAPLMNQVAA